ncbi:MAG: ribosomal protein L13e [Nitrososphaeria archaeon]|nr:ribosomal protein L13e [Nitrososphaeria archaeon]
MKQKIRPIVFSPIYNKPREGRGFSLKEIEDAGLSISIANKLNIPIDRRRKSSHKENVEKLIELVSKCSK